MNHCCGFGTCGWSDVGRQLDLEAGMPRARPRSGDAFPALQLEESTNGFRQDRPTQISLEECRGNMHWVVERHLDRAEDELEELHADYVDILSRSQKASERRYDQEHIADLYTQLETANRLFRDSRR